MSTIDVEPVPEIPLDAPEHVLYGGKGGVGKTTMAAATALASARSGDVTLAISTDPAHSLSDIFETDIPPTPENIHDEYPLYATEIDPDDPSADSPFQSEPLNDIPGGFEEILDDSPGIGGMLPGSDELVAMHQLMRYLDDDRFDRIVIDTAPTGHTLRLLELPDIMDTFVGRILRLRTKLGGLMDNITDVFGSTDTEPEAGLNDLDSFRRGIEQLRSVLRDPHQTDFRIVMVPEHMSVRESRRLKMQLDEFGIPVGTIVVNRVMEPLTDIVDVGASIVTPDVTSCAFCQARWSIQQQAIASAQDLFGGHAIKRVPLFAEDLHDEQMLLIVAACLGDQTA